MVTDQQVRRLFVLSKREKTLGMAAAKSGMDEKTARKYRRLGRLPSEVAVPHTWKTHEDAFTAVWGEIQVMLELNPGLQSKTLFQYLQRKYPGRFTDGQLRTFQRRIKVWRVTEGPGKEVFFPQVHHPGKRSQSDFTCMNDLGVTIMRSSFDHLVYHFVLTYSNWETSTICYSESFESLSTGFQNAVWDLGGVPETHQTDRLGAGIDSSRTPEEFTIRYSALMDHYGIKARRTNASSPHENGDVEQRHHRFKEAVDQSLMLRGSRDFESIEEYSKFLEHLVRQLNAGRQDRLNDELEVLGRLPSRRLEACKRIPRVKVRRSSTINVAHNTYSVSSRLINEHVNIRLYMDHLEVWYGQRKVEDLPRLRGEGKRLINYRHVIGWLVRKPGAFENYVYRDEMFPTTRFRVAYDILRKRHSSSVATREYLGILKFAARESESGVDNVLRNLIDNDEIISFEAVGSLLGTELALDVVDDVSVPDVPLEDYDLLLREPAVVE